MLPSGGALVVYGHHSIFGIAHYTYSGMPSGCSIQFMIPAHDPKDMYRYEETPSARPGGLPFESAPHHRQLRRCPHIDASQQGAIGSVSVRREPVAVDRR